MYGMEKTTVYLPTELKRALERAAQLEGRSEAELIREGVAAIVEPHRVAEPVLPLFESGTGDLAARADEFLEGFGES
jgi:predicted DNA-binding protein